MYFSDAALIKEVTRLLKILTYHCFLGRSSIDGFNGIIVVFHKVLTPCVHRHEIGVP